MSKIDSLKAHEILQLLNNSRYGKVATNDVLNTLKKNADIPFSDKGKINLFKFLLSMLDKRHNPLVRTTRTKNQSYEDEKEYQRARNAERSASGRDIGAIPDIINPERRNACEYDLTLFIETYHRTQAFYYEFSQPMREAIKDLERIILTGGLKALAMPRGSGKTTLLEIAVQWAILYGHRRFIVFIGATVSDGIKSLQAIKTSLETNELLAQDFPEVIFPIKALEGINIRANGQMCLGERTHISWSSDEIILPTIKGAKTSGIILEATGMDGRIRGRKHTDRSGKIVRPDLFTCDDFQTDESALSEEQCKKRLSIINRAIMGLAGAGRAIAGFIPCTVIQLGDAADQLLDRTKYPQFNGSRTKMMISFPKNMDLWDKYNDQRIYGLNQDPPTRKPANDFYREHREELDEGCEVYWADRYDREEKDSNGKIVEGEVSAIQSAMNLYFKDSDSFFSEYQNEPRSLITSLEIMKAEDFAKKFNFAPQRVIPVGATRLVTFIDVQKAVLFFVTCAFDETFSGSVVDYGTFPDQKKTFFTLNEISKGRETIQKLYPDMGFEDALFASLNKLTTDLAERKYTMQTGGTMSHSQIMIDANWGVSTDIVYKICLQSKFASILIPSHGTYVGASTAPFSEYKKKKGERDGDHWRIPLIKGKRAIKHLLYDTNYWKTFVHSRINTEIGGNGHLSLFGDNAKRHELFSWHICKSEYVIETEGRNRKVTEWKEQPKFKENHWFDCLVGCHVLASNLGINLGVSHFKNAKKTKELVSLKSLQNNQNGVKIPEKIEKSPENEKKPISLAKLQQNSLKPDPLKR